MGQARTGFVLLARRRQGDRSRPLSDVHQRRILWVTRSHESSWQRVSIPSVSKWGWGPEGADPVANCHRLGVEV